MTHQHRSRWPAILLIVLLLSGTVELSSDDETERVGSGDCLGVRETLAGGSFLETARIVSGGTALQIDREPLFDLLADRMDENARLPEPRPAEEVERQALVESAVRSVASAVDLGLPEDRIVISCKVSRLPQMVACYRELAQRLPGYPLHLGLTEAGRFVNLMTSRPDDLAGELSAIASARIGRGEWPWSFFCYLEDAPRPVTPSSFRLLAPADRALGLAVNCPACSSTSDSSS